MDLDDIDQPIFLQDVDKLAKNARLVPSPFHPGMPGI
jgi:hypothetical protein